MMTITTKSLRKAVRYVRKHRNRYNQNHWCGTKRCIAGHAVTGCSPKTLDKAESGLLHTDLVVASVQGALERWTNRLDTDARWSLHLLLHRHDARLPAIDAALRKCELEDRKSKNKRAY